MNTVRKAVIAKTKFPDEVLDNSIRRLRGDFFAELVSISPHSGYSTTSALAWQVIVESALLNERLVEDMKEIAAHKNCYCLSTDWMPFYGPNPPPEARAAFKEYVKCRWPVHVFTLDPVTQDQNIATSFSQRREMQLALAIAAANRMISMQSLTRFIRRLEYDLETVELNRTAIGFTHGDDTFGWRFYPRVQTPPVPGNLQATFSDLLVGSRSRDDLARTRMLEPGIRECTALVVMPSFVPYMMVDMKTNWFRLANCKIGIGALDRKMDLEESVQFSRDIVEMRELSRACVEDQHLYRDGEVHRLCRAVDQLERSLPLQTAYTQIPYENRLSGFEMFNSGLTDLGPELIDWYGGPGVYISSGVTALRNLHAAAQNAAAQVVVAQANLATARLKLDAAGIKEYEDALDVAVKLSVAATKNANDASFTASDTTLFLIGKNFTSLGDATRVIAGGADVTHTKRLISRDVMQISIPSTVAVSKDDDGEFVDVHLSTPHGTTGHLHVDIYEPDEPVTALTEKKVGELIDAAVKKTEQKLASPIQFGWSNDEVAGCIEYDHIQNCWLMNITGGIRLQQTNDSPDDHRVDQAQMSAWVYYYVKGKKDRVQLRDGMKKPVSISPIDVHLGTHFQQGVWMTDRLNTPVSVEILKSFAAADWADVHPGDIEKIEIDAFVRARGMATKGVFDDPLPVSRTVKPLTIKLLPCTPCPPAGSGSAATVPLPTTEAATPAPMNSTTTEETSSLFAPTPQGQFPTAPN